MASQLPNAGNNGNAIDNNKNQNNAVTVNVVENVLEELSLAQRGAAPNYRYKNCWVGAIDQGTSSTRFLLFAAGSGRIAASAQMEHSQIYHNCNDDKSEKTGWHEQDPNEIWTNTQTCMQAVSNAVQKHFDAPKQNKQTNQREQIRFNSSTVAALGITNQRETLIAWNKITGENYYNAIVWDDTRTAEHAASFSKRAQRTLTAVTGLPVSSYFAGTKVKWLLDHVPALQRDVQERPDTVCFGTVDSWLLYQLTGQQQQQQSQGNVGGMFCTDVTNASRWLFMDLQTCQWDRACIDTVCAPHKLPLCTLPKICPSAFYETANTPTATTAASDGAEGTPSSFGVIHAECGLSSSSWAGIPITAILGDQQAALFGQAAHTAGQAKNTYGTGLFLMMNTGTTAVPSTHGLLTTVAYQIGRDGPVHYALEGSVSHAGATIQWLRDQLGILSSAAESEAYANSTNSNEGLYFCPAFSGLFAPRWRSDARACIVGMTAAHHKGHVCRAALEAAAYQTKEVFDAIAQDSQCILQSLKVDGGGTNNRFLMQFQADIIAVPVVKPRIMETTALGAAFAAGLAVGVWKDLKEIEDLWEVAETFCPEMNSEIRAKNVAGWNKAVSKSLNWIDNKDGTPRSGGANEHDVNKKYRFGTGSLILTSSVALVIGALLGSRQTRLT